MAETTALGRGMGLRAAKAGVYPGMTEYLAKLVTRQAIRSPHWTPVSVTEEDLIGGKKAVTGPTLGV